MLRNPFTPSQIASEPNDFFGRATEETTLRRSLLQGSVVIQGPIGIGKSSLLAKSRLALEGFGTPENSISFLAVGDKGIRTIDDAARLMLESLVRFDQKKKVYKFTLPKLLEIQSEELCNFFAQNRHLAALKRIIEDEHIKAVLNDNELLLLCIDEADKCPVPIAQLVRSVMTHAQQNSGNRVRFVLAGVTPFFQAMITEDPGLSRFVYKTMNLEPMNDEDATELVETKLLTVVKEADELGIPLRIDPTIVDRMIKLSGGHPHILQLLGSRLVEHENEDPDGILDAHDLFGSLQQICYEDRGQVYESVIHEIEGRALLEGFQGLLQIASPGFPTRISRKMSTEHVTPEGLQWLIDRNILYALSGSAYGLTDEFLRIRLQFDGLQAESKRRRFEAKLLQEVEIPEDADMQDEDEDEDEDEDMQDEDEDEDEDRP